MGGAQPLAVTMNGGVALVVEVDPERESSAGSQRATSTSGLAVSTRRWRVIGRAAREDGAARSASRATPPRCCPNWSRRGIVPDVVTDQTSARTMRSSATSRPACRCAEAARCGRPIPDEYVARAPMAVHGDARARDAGASSSGGAVTFDYGNNIRAQAAEGRRRERLRHSRASCPNTSVRCSAKARARSAGPRCPAIPRTSRRPTTLRSRCSPTTRRCAAGSGWRANASLPGTAGANLLARLRRAGAVRPGASTSWCAAATSKAPIVIGRDHLDAGSVASPNRETEGMRDGSDAIADWPILNALLNAVVRRHLGLGPPRRRRRHRILAARRHGRSWPTARVKRTRRLQRVLTCDPGHRRRAPRGCGLS